MQCFFRYFEIIKNINENNRITNSLLSNNYIKQSHFLTKQGLLFDTINIYVFVDARSHKRKSHDFIPNYDRYKVMVNTTSCRNGTGECLAVLAASTILVTCHVKSVTHLKIGHAIVI